MCRLNKKQIRILEWCSVFGIEIVCKVEATNNHRSKRIREENSHEGVARRRQSCRAVTVEQTGEVIKA